MTSAPEIPREPPVGLTAAAAVLVTGAVVGSVVWADRALARWWKVNSPLAGPKARVARAKSTYLERQEIALDIGLVAAALVVEIARARAMARPRAAR